MAALFMRPWVMRTASELAESSGVVVSPPVAGGMLGDISRMCTPAWVRYIGVMLFAINKPQIVKLTTEEPGSPALVSAGGGYLRDCLNTGELQWLNTGGDVCSCMSVYVLLISKDTRTSIDL